jgi:hypothetical protein
VEVYRIRTPLRMLWLAGTVAQTSASADAGPSPRCTLYYLRDQQTPSGPKARCSLAEAHLPAKFDPRSRWQQGEHLTPLGSKGDPRAHMGPTAPTKSTPACQPQAINF